MKKKMITAVCLSLALLVGMFTGCGNDAKESNNDQETQAAAEDQSETEAADTSDSEAATDGQDLQAVKVGIIQLVEHPALDAARDGFIAGLAEAGYVEGDNLTLDVQNAQGDQSNCQTIAGQFANDDLDLILAIATPAAQAVANVITDTPILVTAVTDLESTQLVDSNEVPGGNVSGTSDMTPIYDQIELIRILFPDIKELGIIYSSGEPNSELQVEGAKEAADQLGMNVTDVTISSTNEIQQVTESIIANVEAIYLPSDNAIASSMPTVAKVALDHNVPIIPAVEAMCAEGGLASIAINYYNLGEQTADMALRIIEDGADVATMPVEFTENPELVINQEYAEMIDYTFPEEVLAKARDAQVE